MPIPKDKTMLQVDSKKILIAMAENMLEPAELAEKAGVPKNIVYAIRRGNYATSLNILVRWLWHWELR